MSTILPTTTIVENLSVEQVTVENQIKLYPNPTLGKTNILLPKSIDLQEITIRSLEGRLIMQSKPADQLDISHLTNGVYLINIKDAKGHQVTKRIIKKKVFSKETVSKPRGSFLMLNHFNNLGVPPVFCLK
ncbi:MAG TPA: T9SS type A sorting domain-containing protein [Flavobacteriaceae bacterium]|nr:T9SS type A sorting domain-containing protein [Flavobacteriaceae bacterium]